MNSTIPKWLLILCCAAPSVTLLFLAGAVAQGTNVSSASMVAVVILCGQISSVLLKTPEGYSFKRIGLD